MSENNLKDKVIVITGGAMGIGLNIADNYLKKGAKITILLDINEKQGKAAVNTLISKHGNNKADFIKCDVTEDLEKVSEVIFKMYNKVDVLVNNAGVCDEADWKKCIDINVTYLIGWSFKFLNHMRKDRSGAGGTIVNIASICGYRVMPFIPVYQASKFAVMGFTKSMGHVDNYKKTGVRIVAICPGFTETSLTTVATEMVWDKTFVANFKDFLKMQAWQKVDVVGSAAVDVFELADSGSAWEIEDGKPIVEIN